MIGAWRSLRVRLAVLGFLAIYVPVLLLFGVVLATDSTIEQTVVDGRTVENVTDRRSPWITWTILALGPAAAGLAWWWAGRAVHPIDRVREVAEDIEGTDLGLRIGLDRGPDEVVALAASFDAMLDRLELAARAQRRLIEETGHELRTPLSVLMTNTEVLLAHPDPTVETYRRGFERSRRAVLRLQTTIDDLLTDARSQARTLDRHPADLMAMVGEVVEDAREQAGARGIELALSGPSAAPCPVDGATVRRALANLVDNAMRYGGAGERIEVAVTLTGHEATIVVTDHGPGIPAGEQERVFERFWRGSRDTPGTGLGLPIARQVAQAHGGDLTVVSPGPDGDGCAFRLTLFR